MPALPLRKIGDSFVSPVGFGLMGIALEAAYGKIESDEERFKVLDAAYEAGCNHWDTADVYGDSEELIGKWLKQSDIPRNTLFIATKFGITASGMIGTPVYIRQQLESSLKKLGVDYVDLYYQHRTDPNTPIEETVTAMAELVKEGKVKYLGLSEVSASTLRRAHAVHPIAAIQVEYSPLVLDIEASPPNPAGDLLKTARELGVKIVAYSPLARGLITGQVTSPDQFEASDCRTSISKFSAANFPKILAVVDSIRTIAEKHIDGERPASAGQVALAWILAQGDDFFVIPGTKKIRYLNENILASYISLSPVEFQEIRKIAEDAEKGIEGDRFMPGWAGFAYVDTPLPK
ncbi:Aldo/keto reductase [Pleurotus eryngii]|uniref:Aldo/keto reductase n=1 Tax=Pleurotus eryngii TaxID=5323 RepID=A0A9P5ZQ68_PLEER|nr:Aldo/keto reductase [Pleurotus eryngii]